MGAVKSAVIIADDDPLVQITYKLCFEQAGYESFTAADGRQALLLLERHPSCTLLLDIFMPDKDGIETLIDVRRLYPQVPVIVISGGACGPYDFFSAAEKLGADAVVRKPASPQLLLSMIEDFARRLQSAGPRVNVSPPRAASA